ncbi:MAG: hypothetical protein WBL70_08175 [Candidatus Acidiferrales bacterium]
MKKVLGGLGILTLVAFSSLAVPTRAATAPVTKRAPNVPTYDISKEVTLEGTVSSVKKIAPGMLPGGHLLVATSKGTVDAHMGPFALNGKHAVSVASGAKVKLVGAMTTFHGNQVFLVRTLEIGSTTYNIRSEHGMPMLIGATPSTKSALLAKGATR